MEGGVQPGVQLVELFVDGDPDGLEDPAGRVAARTAGGRGNGLADDVRQLARGGDRPCGDDGPGDAPGEPGLPVVGEELDERVLVGGVDHVGSGAPDRRVHAHVEGGVPAVGEAPLGHVELGRADAEVEERPGESPLVLRGTPFVLHLSHHRGQGIEARPADHRPVPEHRQLAGGGGHGDGVTVESQQGDARIGLEQRPGVAGTAERGVEDEPRRDGAQQVDDLGGHDGIVGKGLAHPQPLDRHDSCGWSAATVRPGGGGGGTSQWSGRGTAHGPDTFDVDAVPGRGGLARLQRGGTGQ